MSQRFLKIVVEEKARTTLKDLALLLQQDPSPHTHTDRIVNDMGIVSGAFNESYFLQPLVVLGADEKVLKNVRKALDASMTIQNKMVKKAFDKYTKQDLLHIAKLMEERLPVIENGVCFFKIPVDTIRAERSDKLAHDLRSNPKKGKFNDELVKLANDGLQAILDYEMLQPLAEMKAKFLVVKVVEWAIKLWKTMNAYETKRIVNKMSESQLIIYADLIEQSMTVETAK